MDKDNLISMAQKAGYTEDEFRDQIFNIYASINDHDLDSEPDGEIEHSVTFGGHKLVITIHRELLN